MNPGGYKDRLWKPAVPVNPVVYFLSAHSIDGRPSALMANGWMHDVSIAAPQSHISAGYFGSFCERIEQLLEAGWGQAGEIFTARMNARCMNAR